MKKSILTIALMAMVSVTASAVSIDWGSSALSFNGTVLKNSGIGNYLLYISEGTLSEYTVDTAFTSASVGTTVSQDADGTSKAAKLTGKFSFDFGSYVNGDAFALLVSYTDEASNKTYYNLSSIVNTISGLDESISTPKFNEFTFASNVNEPGTKLTAGGGWTPAVPEPATGALALAGLALLFRRKRA